MLKNPISDYCLGCDLWLKNRDINKEGENMIPCDVYICNNCDCEFYFPTDFNPTDATLDHTIICPRCNSHNCNKC